MENEAMKEKDNNVYSSNTESFLPAFIFTLFLAIGILCWHISSQSEYSKELDKIKTITVTKFNDGMQSTSFSEEFIQGNSFLISLNITGNEHDLSLTTLNDGKTYRVEVIPTDNGEFLGISFPEGELLFGNDGDARLNIKTENIKEYPYNIELNYLESVVKICIE